MRARSWVTSMRLLIMGPRGARSSAHGASGHLNRGATAHAGSCGAEKGEADQTHPPCPRQTRQLHPPGRMQLPESAPWVAGHRRSRRSASLGDQVAEQVSQLLFRASDVLIHVNECRWIAG